MSFPRESTDCRGRRFIRGWWTRTGCGLDPRWSRDARGQRGGRRADPGPTLGLSSAAVERVATVYLAGEVVGALFFGRLSDKLGRRNLFMITLGVYLVGGGFTAFTLGNSAGWIVFLYVTGFIAGMGIGEECPLPSIRRSTN